MLKTCAMIAVVFAGQASASWADIPVHTGSYGLGKTGNSPGASGNQPSNYIQTQKALQDARNDSNAAKSIQVGKGWTPSLAPSDMLSLYANFLALENAFSAYVAAVEQDKAFQPQLDANSGPGLPVHCQTLDAQALAAEDERNMALAQGKPVKPVNLDAGQCLPCYSAAEEKVNARRIAFERLRVILVYTKAMATSGEGVLTAAGTAGGLTDPMVAQDQIRKVEESMTSFYAAYDSKYAEILSNFKASLDEFAVCEKKYFDNPDWYARYGFLYYQFMADRYKRT